MWPGNVHCPVELLSLGSNVVMSLYTLSETMFGWGLLFKYDPKEWKDPMFPSTSSLNFSEMIGVHSAGQWF